MEMVKRYIYAVTKSLPERQREEISRELGGLIEDMLEEQDPGLSYDEKVEAVLVQLGDPEAMADNYRGHKRYLIGPRFYDTYLTISKIVCTIIFIVTSIAVAISYIFDKSGSPIQITANYFSTVIGSVIQALAMITIGFIIVERKYEGKGDSLGKRKWNVKNLPPIPDKKASIPVGEPVASIIFSTVFLSILLYAPSLIAVYTIPDTSIPVLNIASLSSYRILFILIYLLNLTKDIIKLYYRKWTLKSSVISSLMICTGTIMFVALFKNPDIWSSEFVSSITTHYSLSLDFEKIWNGLKAGLLATIVIIGIIEIASSISKGLKYGR